VTDRHDLVKCLVWDLDNTLWQGTLTEGDDVEVPGPVRQVISMLDSRGILQSIASKNDHDEAWARLEKLGLAEFFVLPKISWGPKSAAVAEIARQLKFACKTIAFVDDQPAERAEVAYHQPEVRCYPAEQVLTLVDLPEFTPATVTADSRRRRQMYQAAFRREAEQAAFAGPAEDFLRSLELEMTIGRAGEQELARVEELTVRTSQMNATGVHYSGERLLALLADPAHEVLVISMQDRFGPHGAVGVVLLQTHQAVWHLKLLATSCRVVSFGAGTAILNWLTDQAARAGCHLAADLRPTGRNRMMEVAYRFAGFTGEHCDCLSALETAAGEAETQRLHLRPSRKQAPTTMRLLAPELAAPVKGRP
jgi:methoxymalonate biosynthesis protein